MFVKDIMQKKVISIGPDATIREASRLMKKNRIGYLLVTNSGSLRTDYFC
jgi:predicted transcriptional regulator